MMNETEMRDVIGATAYGSDGEKIGKVGQLFLDDETGEPEFVTVNTGFFGTSESFVPVTDAEMSSDRLTVPYTKDHVKDAPNVDVDGGHLDPSEEQRLYAHYGRTYTPPNGQAGIGAPVTGTAGVGTGNVAEPATGTASDTESDTASDTAMTRSEEHLEVGTTSQEAGRARLRKYVTTEMETHTVPVRKERAVVETEPITSDNMDEATSGPDISEDEHEVVLHEERPVTETVTEPVERVRLGTETTTEEEQVSGEVRKEQIETEGDVGRS
jgi:stress response protein YsnF